MNRSEAELGGANYESQFLMDLFLKDKHSSNAQIT